MLDCSGGQWEKAGGRARDGETPLEAELKAGGKEGKSVEVGLQVYARVRTLLEVELKAIGEKGNSLEASTGGTHLEF